MATKIQTNTEPVDTTADDDFLSALWAWLPADHTAKRDEPCLICGVPVPATWITDEGFCPICAAQ